MYMHIKNTMCIPASLARTQDWRGASAQGRGEPGIVGDGGGGSGGGGSGGGGNGHEAGKSADVKPNMMKLRFPPTPSHTCTHARTHARTHTHTRAHTHTCMQHTHAGYRIYTRT